MFFRQARSAVDTGDRALAGSQSIEDEGTDTSVEISFPLELVVEGVPLSLQASSASLVRWRERLRNAMRPLLPAGHFVSADPMKVTVYYFAAAQGAGDVDNIIKPILDAFCKLVYFDDSQVEHVVARRFDPGRLFTFRGPTPALAEAIEAEGPRVYLRIDVSTVVDVT